jgi:aminomethyltransferase
MPIEYRGTMAEHAAVREAVGLFDLSHLGKIVIEGPGALDLLQRTMPNDLSSVPVGGAQYNMVLNEHGGIVDDLINYRLGDDRYLVVPNAANVGKVLWILHDVSDPGVTVDHRNDMALIAPQGPRSTELVASVFPEAADLGYLQCAETHYRGRPVVVSRSG